MWVHFETFSVIQKPTYQCYTPAAQGLILAAGQIIAGHPFWELEGADRKAQEIHFGKNLGIIGGLVLVLTKPR